MNTTDPHRAKVNGVVAQLILTKEQVEFMLSLKGLQSLRVIFQRRLLNTLQYAATFQLVVKHSKFIAHAKSVATKEDALAFIEGVRDLKATHNCFAYKLGSDERASDDGEVAGTAGKQILGGEHTTAQNNFLFEW